MPPVDLTVFDDTEGFTFIFDGPPGLIAAETLADALSGLSDALEAIAEVVNPGEPIEVYVDSFTTGSVKIGLKLSKKTVKTIKTVTAATVIAAPMSIIINVYSSYLYDHVKPDEKCVVDIDASHVHVTGDHCDVRIAREVYDTLPKLRGNTKVAKGVRKTLETIRKDKAVTGVGIATSSISKPVVYVERAQLNTAIDRLKGQQQDTPAVYQHSLLGLRPETRVQKSRANLIILKAWLKRGKRKWSFNWQGINISASIIDPDFFDQLEARSISLSQGDGLEAEITITQQFIPDANVWENKAYVVSKVISVTIGEAQTTMDFSVRTVTSGRDKRTLEDE